TVDRARGSAGGTLVLADAAVDVDRNVDRSLDRGVGRIVCGPATGAAVAASAQRSHERGGEAFDRAATARDQHLGYDRDLAVGDGVRHGHERGRGLTERF